MAIPPPGNTTVPYRTVPYGYGRQRAGAASPFIIAVDALNDGKTQGRPRQGRPSLHLLMRPQQAREETSEN